MPELPIGNELKVTKSLQWVVIVEEVFFAWSFLGRTGIGRYPLSFLPQEV